MVACNNISVYGSVQFWVLIQILEACIYLEDTISVLCVFNLADTAFFSLFTISLQIQQSIMKIREGMLNSLVTKTFVLKFALKLRSCML
jgi:hypothetical protein